MKKSLIVLLTLASIATSTTAVWADIASPLWRESQTVEIIPPAKTETPVVHIKKIDPNENKNEHNSIYLMSILLFALIFVAGRSIKKELKNNNDKKDN